MRQVQLHKAMLMQEVQQLKSANVPKIEAYRRLNAEAKKISWPTFLKYYNADEVPSAKSISANYEKQKVFDVEPFRKKIIRCVEANRDNKDSKISSIYDLLEEPCVREMDYVDEQAIPYGEQAQLDYSQ